MGTFINILLLVGVLALPTAIAVFLVRVLRRRGMNTHYEPPDTIDYDKW